MTKTVYSVLSGFAGTSRRDLSSAVRELVRSNPLSCRAPPRVRRNLPARSARVSLIALLGSAVLGVAVARAQDSSSTSCSPLSPEQVRALRLAIDAQIAALENQLKRLDRPIPAIEPDARRSLQARYRNLLDDARAAQHELEKTVRALASASSPAENCRQGEDHD
jgi:hypothetical protein